MGPPPLGGVLDEAHHGVEAQEGRVDPGHLELLVAVADAVANLDVADGDGGPGVAHVRDDARVCQTGAMSESLTLMAVHAHPDDESSSTGGVLGMYGDEGVRTVLVTCTNGELGGAPDHVKPDEEGHDEKEVAKVRLAELRSAVEILGVSHSELLGYHDSGMPDWRFREREDAFCNVPRAESEGRLVALFERYRPDVVITYDDNGGYNHPDHLQAHRITVAATEQ